MWICARVKGIGTRAEHRASTDLKRHGVESFWPQQHRYFIDRLKKQERYRESALLPGYLFCRLRRPIDRDIISGCYFLSYVLGSWTGERFLPREIPGSYVTALIEHGPFEINKMNTKGRFKIGQKVKVALNALTEIIGEYKGEVDGKGKAVINVSAFGKTFDVQIGHERLAAAE